MNQTLSTGFTAWMVAAMLVAQALLGLLRVGRRILRRLHIVLGILLIPVTFFHAWMSMKTVSMKSANTTGLWLATAALLLLGVQLSLGTALIRPSGSRSLTRLHLTVGVAIVSLAGAHVLLIK